jgi:class 3 adenylate cyclase
MIGPDVLHGVHKKLVVRLPAHDLDGSACRERQSRRSAPRVRRSPDAAGRELGTSPGPALESLAKLLQGDQEPVFVGGQQMRTTFVFTDVERSTDLVGPSATRLGTNLRAWHDRALRGLFAEHGGEEIDHAGDGFFVAFPDAPGLSAARSRFSVVCSSIAASTASRLSCGSTCTLPSPCVPPTPTSARVSTSGAHRRHGGRR